MTITLDPDLENQLRQAAIRRGQDPEQYLHAVLARAIGDDLKFEDDEDRNPNALAEAIERLRLTPERRAEALARAADLKPHNPPPPGTSGMDRVFGKWPGDESEEELLAALRVMDDEDAGRA